MNEDFKNFRFIYKPLHRNPTVKRNVKLNFVTVRDLAPDK